MADGSIVIDTKIDSSDLGKQLGDVKKQLSSGLEKAAKGATKALGGITAAAAGIGALSAKFVSLTSEIRKTANMAGVGAEEFQALEYAGSRFGVSADAMADGLKEMQLRTDEFIETGAGPAAEALRRLGYDMDELKAGLADADGFFVDIITRMEDMDRAAQLRIADEMFGGQAAEQFVEMIDAGGQSIEDMAQQARDMGLVMDSEVLDAGRELRNAFDDVKRVITVAAAELAGEFSGQITQAVVDFGKWATESNNLKNVLQETIPLIAKIGGALFTAFIASNIIQTIQGLTVAFKALKLALATLNPIVLAITGVIAGVAAAVALINKRQARLKQEARDAWTEVAEGARDGKEAIEDFKEAAVGVSDFFENALIEDPERMAEMIEKLADKYELSKLEVVKIADETEGVAEGTREAIDAAESLFMAESRVYAQRVAAENNRNLQRMLEGQEQVSQEILEQSRERARQREKEEAAARRQAELEERRADTLREAGVLRDLEEEGLRSTGFVTQEIIDLIDAEMEALIAVRRETGNLTEEEQRRFDTLEARRKELAAIGGGSAAAPEPDTPQAPEPDTPQAPDPKDVEERLPSGASIFAKGLSEFLAGEAAAITEAGGTMIGILKKSLVAGAVGIGLALSQVIDFKKIFGELKGGFSWLGDKIYDLTRDLPFAKGIYDAIKENGGIIAAAGLAAVNILMDTIKWGFGAIRKVLDWASLFSPKNLLKSIEDFAKNLIKFFDKTLGSIPIFFDKGVELIEDFLAGMEDRLPMIVETIGNVLEHVLTVTIEKGPSIVGGFLQIIFRIVETIAGNIPMIVEAFLGILLTVAQYVANNIEMIVDAIITFIASTIEWIGNNAGELIDIAISIILGIVLGITQNLDKIIFAIIDAIPKIHMAIIGAIPDLIVAILIVAGALISGLVKGLVAGIAGVVKAIYYIGKAIVDAFKGFFGINSPSKTFSGFGRSLIDGLVSGIKGAGSAIWGKIKGVFTGILDGIRNLFSGAADIGSNLVSGVTSGISSAAGAVTGAASSAWDAVTGWFADGTKSAPGGPAIVGEEGPELVDLPAGSRVFPADQTRDMMRGISSVASGMRPGVPSPAGNVIKIDNRMTGTIEVDGEAIGRVAYENLDRVAT